MTEGAMMKFLRELGTAVKRSQSSKNFKIVQDLLERKGKINLGFLGRVFYHGALFVMVKK